MTAVLIPFVSTENNTRKICILFDRKGIETDVQYKRAL